MKWTIWQWAALIWIVAIFATFLGIPLTGRYWNAAPFWFILVGPFVTASLLGIWLIAGVGPVWLRMLGVLVGQSLLVWLMMYITLESAVAFTPGLAASTASTALAMLALGCMNSILPIQSTWNVRIALWEIVVSIGLIGLALAIMRVVSGIDQWRWPDWASSAGVHFLVFAAFTGLLMTLALMPLIVRGRGPRWGAALMLLAAVVLIPPIETLTFNLFRLDGGDLELFYPTHIGQTVMALAIMIPLTVFFPGVLVRQTRVEVKPDKPAIEPSPQPSDEHDFADMQ